MKEIFEKQWQNKKIAFVLHITGWYNPDNIPANYKSYYHTDSGLLKFRGKKVQLKGLRKHRRPINPYKGRF